MSFNMVSIEHRPLTSLLKFIVDNRGKTVPTSDEGIPLIATNCIKDNELYPVFERVRYISQDTYDNWFRAHPIPGDIIFVNKGTPGRVCLVPDPIDFCIAQDMMALRVDEDVIDNRYLFAVLRSPLFQNQINNYHVGTMIPHFKKGDLDKLLIPIPSMRIQEIIGDYYFTLSHKIETNNRMNKVLDQMAQVIFKQWFVDFEYPNENGDPYKLSGGEMEWCEEMGREIPKGWLIDTIGNSTSLVTRGIAPKYAENSEKRVINQKCIRDGSINLELSRPHISKVSEDKQIQFGDILVNSTGTGTLGRVAQVYEDLEDYTVDSHVTIIRPNLENGLGYMGCLIKNMQPLFENAATGSTGQTELGREIIKKMKILLPESHINEKFSGIYHSICEKMIRSQKENIALSNLRDTLLPKLISGELDVSEIQL